jgi:hypothetical protein
LSNLADQKLLNRLAGVSGGALAISSAHIFASNAARDTYFAAHVAEKTTGVFIAVGAGFQQWDGTAWQDKTAVVQGLPGIGTAGAPGSVWRTGSGAPANSLGIDGDFYINTATSDVYQRAASVYGVVLNIKGAPATPGAAGSITPITATTYNGSGQLVSYTQGGVVHTITYSTINGTSIPVSDAGGGVTRTFHWKNTTPPQFDFES